MYANSAMHVIQPCTCACVKMMPSCPCCSHHHQELCAAHCPQAYSPAASLSYAERCELNFGATPLDYPVEGFEPMQAAPPAGQRALCGHLLECWARLAHAACAPATTITTTTTSDCAASTSQQQQQEGGGGGGGGGSLEWDDALMLGAALAQHLAPLLVGGGVCVCVGGWVEKTELLPPRTPLHVFQHTWCPRSCACRPV